MEKEILTREIIKKEISRKLILTIIEKTVVALFFISLCSLLWHFHFSLAEVKKPIEKAELLYYTIPLLIFVLIVIVSAIISALKLWKVFKDNFIITSDTVVGKHTKEYLTSDYEPDVQEMSIFRTIPYRLHFAEYGIYKIPRGQNYKWSNINKMTGKRVYEGAKLKDEFYLIIIGKYILEVYNTKLFEYKE